ncbi:LamG domain-containing protein [Stenotrophomonas sp. C3(2023)]|uniref:LamG-like jellyroll fold domain-containing protein n=1 Tax=Stenotrophomonas sp. C3(2023) TaxID=3080277 RepID=UPI00293C767C|nr:LamG-like jellyroll fold domain-containing protein [Stenotrophomonas sp. C3(2023)]MDV3467206.1 LamG domain-containing protein [Stenotrophomonas sp. C3(2023)]
MSHAVAPRSLRPRLLALACALATSTPVLAAQTPTLLFHVDASHGLDAVVASGEAVPNFRDKVQVVDDAALGKAIQWQDDGVLAWDAPGNIQAQRGTLAFDWRPRYAVGEAPFVIFRVGYADHSSWDMAWLRIDWNGQGFDAFVTDANLARTRVSFKLDKRPDPKQWLHMAFAWDEDHGVRLFIDGREVARVETTGDYDAALDQLGLAGRVMAPYQVQSRYNFLRGSDFQHIRVYDRMLDGTAVAALARGKDVTSAVAAATDQRAWLHRFGWEGAAPPALSADGTRIRKIEFADTKDLKQWMWKGTDGIAETTWPGVYNRSRLPGRDDYFQLPDWNTYVEAGQHLDLSLPEGETVNRIEIRGAAFGTLAHGSTAEKATDVLFTRPQGPVRSVNDIAPQQGGVLRFSNVEQETPIQEIWGYHVDTGPEPDGIVKQTYLIDSQALPDYTNLDALRAYIDGRFAPAERSTVMALPKGAGSRRRGADSLPASPLPIVHVLVPSGVGDAPANQPLIRSWAHSWENMYDGLDGVAIDLPALDLPATHDGLIPLNIRIKDPIWPARDMIDVSVSVQPGKKRTVWLDLRDRILTADSLWLSIASAAPGFDANALDGAEIRMVFKPRAEAIKEHVADRFNQVRDNWGFLVEEHTTSKRQRLYARVYADLSDLLRVDPDHEQGRLYWNYISYNSQGKPPFTLPQAPAGVPTWAFNQVQDLAHVRRFIDWWIDHRQVAYGDFGGGISDDSDLTQQWPGLALMGVKPDRINASLTALSDAVYRNGMFSNGLSTIETDELHSYEEGINTNSAMLYLNWGDPLTVERLMETVKALDERIILPNPQGHLLFSSNWFGGNKIYREPNWQWQKPYSFPILHPAFLLGQFNADPIGRKLVVGLADSYLAHAYTDDKGRWALPNEINWATGETRGGELNNGSGSGDIMHTFWAAWRWTGDDKYLKALDYRVQRGGPGALANLGENYVEALGRQAEWYPKLQADAEAGKTGFNSLMAWQATGDTRFIADLHAEGIQAKAQREYMNTDGHWWSDRVEAPSEFLQRARLGGIALKRNQTWPGHTVSWRFDQEDAAEQVALLVHAPSREAFTVTSYNLGKRRISAAMTGWNVAPGTWTVRSGVDSNGDGRIDGRAVERDVQLETSMATELQFQPGRTEIFEFTLKRPGTPVEQRADLGIGRGDVRVQGRQVEVTVHSLGHVASGTGVAILEDARGREVARTEVPAMEAPSDLTPRTRTVQLPLPAGDRNGLRVRIALADGSDEVTQLNNVVDIAP